jgi:hypothetical protein
MLIAPVRQTAVVFCGFIVLGVLLVGCMPDPVYRLAAHAPDSTGFWRQRRQVVPHTVDSLQVAAAYARTTDEGHKFRLAFVNRSPAPVTVDPTDVYAVVTKKLSDRERVHIVEEETQDGTPEYEMYRDTLTTADTLYARNPEQVLLRIDKERAREEAAAERDATADALFHTLDAVSEIASGPESPDERAADAAEDTEYQLQSAENRARRRRTRARLHQRRAR